MTELQFWQLVSTTDPLADSDHLANSLTEKLTPLGNEELAAFDKIFNQKMRQAYTWDLWGAAFVIAGCNSEFAFAEFRCWLISRGQTIFEQALANPDSLAKLEIHQKDEYANPYLDEYDLIAGQLYENRTEQELPFVPSGQTQPQGKRFKDKARLVKKTYPELFAKYWTG
ncbi:DUF4240 domain-containing protein [Psychrobium sp. 1_MG-2023]|uniref:DUF4240 domain-containing protein n=1 Tax=Psychrobium sp. 1_MG-2023 TaxID=3062624 RepID=UPI000C33780F|nr:DUF4240 domain-containing protein [Psychrobium sp. 1_MG-2023]MDP2561950.1 DUF4240 domain-containing protein [Psychrobium sp. 1_MG-2023]PKF58668.1 hypothetical protein CW748_03265 [Alteromonadales bacterium alter-6D02]